MQPNNINYAIWMSIIVCRSVDMQANLALTFRPGMLRD